jgi:hypothetical protein
MLAALGLAQPAAATQLKGTQEKTVETTTPTDQAPAAKAAEAPAAAAEARARRLEEQRRAREEAEAAANRESQARTSDGDAVTGDTPPAEAVAAPSTADELERRLRKIEGEVELVGQAAGARPTWAALVVIAVLAVVAGGVLGGGGIALMAGRRMGPFAEPPPRRPPTIVPPAPRPASAETEPENVVNQSLTFLDDLLAMGTNPNSLLHASMQQPVSEPQAVSAQNLAEAIYEIFKRQQAQAEQHRQASDEITQRLDRLIKEHDALKRRLAELERDRETPPPPREAPPVIARTPPAPAPLNDPPPVAAAAPQAAPEPPGFGAAARALLVGVRGDANDAEQFEALVREEKAATADPDAVAGWIAAAFKVLSRGKTESGRSRNVVAWSEDDKAAFEQFARACGAARYNVIWPEQHTQANSALHEIRRVGQTSDLVIGVLQPGLASGDSVHLRAVVQVG